MRAKGTSIWLKRIALLLLCSSAAGSVASAQMPLGHPSLETTLIPGLTAWITDSSGREQKTHIAGVSGGIVMATADDGGVRRFAMAEIMRVRVRHADPLWNGALIGAGAAVASGLFLCTRTEPWANCDDDIGPMFGIGAIGAGAGIGIDALIRGRRTIYDAARPSTRLYLAPVLAPRAGGVRVSLRF